jgi:dihydrofolate reductase
MRIDTKNKKTRKRTKRKRENKKSVKAKKKQKTKKMEKGKLSVLHIHALREVTTQNRLLILERQMFHQNATEGKLIMGNKTWETVELPWKENQKNISCIPSGTYTWQKIIRSSNKQPALYIRDVENRTEILIHEGNKPTQSEGCILLHNYRNFHRLVNNKGLIVII